jgi:ubiquinone/menaquinone biosynthesis C-methylase UbiE
MQNKEAEKAFFAQFVAERRYDVFDERGYERLLREFSRLISSSRGERFLDIGCGTGAFTRYLARWGLKGVGLDLSLENVLNAPPELSEVEFVAGDAEALPFSDNEFDIVTFSGILHHLTSMQPALAESYRVLRPGGRLFAYDPNGRNPAMWLYRSPRSPFSSREGWTANERLLLSEDIESCLHRAGFRDAACEGVSGISFRYVENPVLRRLLGIYNLLDTCLAKTRLSRRHGAFVVSYARKLDN